MSRAGIIGLTVAIAAVAGYLYYEGDLSGLGSSVDGGSSGPTGPLVPALASAFQQMEGWFDGSVSESNNNPGNIEGTGDAGSSGPYAVYSSYAAGYQALEGVLTKLVTNNPTWTLQQGVNYYVNGDSASTAQNTVPYAQGVASILSSILGTSVTPNTALGSLAS